MNGRLSVAAREVLLRRYAEQLEHADVGFAALLASRRSRAELAELAAIAGAVLARPSRHVAADVEAVRQPALASGGQLGDALLAPRDSAPRRNLRVLRDDYDLPENRILAGALHDALARALEARTELAEEQLLGSAREDRERWATVRRSLQRAAANRAVHSLRTRDGDREAAHERVQSGAVPNVDAYTRLLAWLDGVHASAPEWPSTDDRLDDRLFSAWAADEAIAALAGALGEPRRRAGALGAQDELAAWDAPAEPVDVRVLRRAGVDEHLLGDRALIDALGPSLLVRVRTRIPTPDSHGVILEAALPDPDLGGPARAVALVLAARACVTGDPDGCVVVFGEDSRSEVVGPAGWHVGIVYGDPARPSDGARAWRDAVLQAALEPCGLPRAHATEQADAEEGLAARAQAVAAAALARLNLPDSDPARKVLRAALGDDHASFDATTLEMLAASEHIALSLPSQDDHSGAVLGLFAALEHELQVRFLREAADNSAAVQVDVPLGPALRWLTAAARRAAGEPDRAAELVNRGRPLTVTQEEALDALAAVIGDRPHVREALEAFRADGNLQLRNAAAHGSRTLDERAWQRARRLILGPAEGASAGWLRVLAAGSR